MGNGNSATIRKCLQPISRNQRKLCLRIQKEIQGRTQKGQKKSRSYENLTKLPIWKQSWQVIQSYITALSNSGSVISISVGTAAAKALSKQHPSVIADLDLESSSWAQSLFRQREHVSRRHSSMKVDIPDAAKKEIEYVFLYEIVSKNEKYSIRTQLSSNLTIHHLTLFRMGRAKSSPPPPPSSCSPVTSTNVGITPKTFLTLSFNPFDTLV